MGKGSLVAENGNGEIHGLLQRKHCSNMRAPTENNCAKEKGRRERSEGQKIKKEVEKP